MPTEFADFEAFWPHFLRSHAQRPTRWMHTIGVGFGAAGLALTVVTAHPAPALVGGALFAACALGAHPLFEGDRAQNLGHPLWGLRANVRMAVRTVRGTLDAEVEDLLAAPATA